ncbi:unnamed protein product [Amoebophrya sp. A120]|nr:unnamed protein product [Amoebophrya sp. A120]|eukprot:GSA120T00001056001.1
MRGNNLDTAVADSLVVRRSNQDAAPPSGTTEQEKMSSSLFVGTYDYRPDFWKNNFSSTSASMRSSTTAGAVSGPQPDAASSAGPPQRGALYKRQILPIKTPLSKAMTQRGKKTGNLAVAFKSSDAQQITTTDQHGYPMQIERTLAGRYDVNPRFLAVPPPSAEEPREVEDHAPDLRRQDLVPSSAAPKTLNPVSHNKRDEVVEQAVNILSMPGLLSHTFPHEKITKDLVVGNYDLLAQYVLGVQFLYKVANLCAYRHRHCTIQEHDEGDSTFDQNLRVLVHHSDPALLVDEEGLELIRERKRDAPHLEDGPVVEVDAEYLLNQKAHIFAKAREQIHPKMNSGGPPPERRTQAVQEALAQLDMSGATSTRARGNQLNLERGAGNFELQPEDVNEDIKSDAEQNPNRNFEPVMLVEEEEQLQGPQRQPFLHTATRDEEFDLYFAPSIVASVTVHGGARGCHFQLHRNGWVSVRFADGSKSYKLSHDLVTAAGAPCVMDHGLLDNYRTTELQPLHGDDENTRPFHYLQHGAAANDIAAESPSHLTTSFVSVNAMGAWLALHEAEKDEAESIEADVNDDVLQDDGQKNKPRFLAEKRALEQEMFRFLKQNPQLAPAVLGDANPSLFGNIYQKKLKSSLAPLHQKVERQIQRQRAAMNSEEENEEEEVSQTGSEGGQQQSNVYSKNGKSQEDVDALEQNAEEHLVPDDEDEEIVADDEDQRKRRVFLDTEINKLDPNDAVFLCNRFENTVNFVLDLVFQNSPKPAALYLREAVRPNFLLGFVRSRWQPKQNEPNALEHEAEVVICAKEGDADDEEVAIKRYDFWK